MRKKLLLIDDSSFIRMVMIKALQHEDIDIYEAENGKLGFERYKEIKPDLVTMDITMPDESGLDTLSHIKEYDERAKIIMCSSVFHKKNVQLAVERGAIGFMIKPFKDEVFLETILKNI